MSHRPQDSDPTLDEDIVDHIDVQPVERRRWFRRSTQSHLITDADQTVGQNRRQRETIYTALQVLRLVLLVLGLLIAAFGGWWQLALLTVFVTIPIPWIAVVVANDGNRKRDKREQAVYKPAVARHMAAQIEADNRAAHRALPKPEDTVIDSHLDDSTER